MLNEKTAPFPEWVVPMAATLIQERFTGPEWIFERKLDGIRMLAFKNSDDVKLYSRNRLLQHYPAVAAAIARLPANELILDGEAAWDSSSRIAYHLFDILWLDGRPVMPEPLDSRRALLATLPLRRPLARVPEVTDSKPWERACSEGWEGVIAKRRTSPYEERRSPHWLKMKCEASQELVVGGFTDPQGRRLGLGALLVGYFARDEFVFAGKIGTGFDTRMLLDLRARLDALEIPKPPFTEGPRTAARSNALGTAGNRRAGCLHRVDGSRQAAPSAAAWNPLRQIAPGGDTGNVVITHPEKVLFPATELPKANSPHITR